MGTPMILMGDEILRTQKGNNNAYCQDNELSYMNWDLNERQQDMLHFTQAIIKRRTIRSRAEGHERRHVKMLDSVLRSTKLQWHGVLPFQPDWSFSSHSIGVLVYWSTYSIYAYVFVNAFWEDLEIELPAQPRNIKRHWLPMVDTSQKAPDDVVIGMSRKRYCAGDKLKVQARSIVMLISPA